MDLLAFEHDRSFVLEALRCGEIDYLEHVGEAVEGDFFRQLIDRQVLQCLADSYPTPRKKEEVPVWLYLASELSLKLHGRAKSSCLPTRLALGRSHRRLGAKARRLQNHASGKTFPPSPTKPGVFAAGEDDGVFHRDATLIA